MLRFQDWSHKRASIQDFVSSHADFSLPTLIATRTSSGLWSTWTTQTGREVSSVQIKPPQPENFAASRSSLPQDGSIAWNHVAVSPNVAGEFPSDAQVNRYYTARETASSPLRVRTSAREQQEKFLFYRRVSASPLPLSASLTSNGRLLVKRPNGDEIPNAILFERAARESAIA